MANNQVSNSVSLKNFMDASEQLCATVSGHAVSDSLLKVSNGALFLIDGFLPVFMNRVTFDLEGVLAGATQVVQGVNAAVLAAKSPAVSGTVVPSVSISGL